ncbi:MAG: membrane protein [Phycisphaerae bacterium]
MSPARFLETRGPAWDRLEALIARCGRHGLRALSEEELHELTRLYPSVAVDVARARLYKLAPQTQQRINRLAISAHGLLYRRSRGPVLPLILRFFRYDYPRLFRRLWAYTALATVIFLVAAAGAYVTTQVRPATAYLFVPGDLDMPDGNLEVSSADISDRFRSMPSPPMAAGIITNNISVAFTAFAFGITAGIGTCYLLLFNAMMLGGIAGHFANHRLSYEFWSFIAPHGVLEIMTIMIAAGAGLRMGLALAVPGDQTRLAALRAGAREAVLLVIGTMPLFVVAGLVEGFITPSYLPGGLKMALGLGLGVTALSYLVLVGRTDGPAAATTGGSP